MRNYRLKIGLDVDDVLYQCNQYAIDILKKKYGPLPELDINKLTVWGYQGNKADERMPMYSDPEFVRTQPMFPGAQRFVAELNKIADVFFVTAVPPNCMSARAERLMKDFPEIPVSNIIIGTRKDVIHLDILLDDAAHNISVSTANHPVLMRRPWNQDLSGLLSVNSYDDFIHLAKTVRNSFVQKKPDLTSGGVLCLVGSTGTGKTEITAELIKDKRFVKPQTTTTRARRDGEPENAYTFVTDEEFIKLRDAGKFIETTVYGGFHYGASAEQLTPIVSSGKIAVIPIDICGALTLKNHYRNKAMVVFTDRSKQNIIMNILSRKTTNEDKARRIMSLDFEARNVELCDCYVNFDNGCDVCVKSIIHELGW